MKKGMMTHINKILSCFVILSLLIGSQMHAVSASSFSLTSNKASITPNGTFKVTVTAEGAGKFDISALNAKVSESSIWVDGSETFTVTALKEGTVKITVTASDAYDWKENKITGKKTVEVKVQKASTQVSDGDNGTNALTTQLSIADKLKRTNYTDESWQVLLDALRDAKEVAKGNDQPKMNQAAIDLKYAMDSLVEIDRTELQDAINQAKSILDKEDIKLFNELLEVLENNEDMLSSTSQQEVDIATDKILNVIDKINNSSTSQNDDQGINLWVVLFVVSFVVNLAGVYMLVRNSKRRFNDDIPVVDYDISDDNV